MSQDFSVWGNKETIQLNLVDLYMKGQAISREKAFVPDAGTMMISSHQLSINRKSKWPFVSKLIPGELPAHDASFCIWQHFRNDFVDSATVSSLFSNLFTNFSEILHNIHFCHLLNFWVSPVSTMRNFQGSVILMTLPYPLYS